LYRLATVLPGADGTLFTDGDAWKLRLKALMPGFTPSAMAASGPALKAAVADAVAKWPEAGPDLFDTVSAVGLQVVLRTGYNLDLTVPCVQRFGELLRVYKRTTMRDDPAYRLDDFGVVRRGLGSVFPIVRGFWGLARLMRAMDLAVREILASKPWADANRVGWVQRLLAAGMQGRALTSELNHLYGAFTAADHVATCLLATVAGTPTWRALQQGDGALLEATLRETYRRFPVTMVIYRRLGAPEVLGGEEAPAGSTVMILPYALHHDPEWWSAPEELRPERWLEGVGPAAQAAFEPFLAGSRRCIGRDYAQSYLRTLVRALVPKALTIHAPLTVTTWVIPRPRAPIPFQTS
jgi:cytochrome P450